MAFTAEDRSDVEKMYELLKQMGAKYSTHPPSIRTRPDTSQSISLILTVYKFEFAHAPGCDAIEPNRPSTRQRHGSAPRGSAGESDEDT